MSWLDPKPADPGGCGGEGCSLSFPHAGLVHAVLDDDVLSKLARRGLFIVSTSSVTPPPADPPETPTDRKKAGADPDVVREAIAAARAVLRAADDAVRNRSRLVGGSGS